MSSPTMTAIDLLIRVTLLLGLGTLAALALHRRSASMRHLVWATSLGGSLVLAVLVPWAPRIDLPLKRWPGAIGNLVVAPDISINTGASVSAATSSFPGLVNVAPTPNEGINENRIIISSSPRPSLWLKLWVSGALLVGAWGVFGRLGLALLTRRARPLSTGGWRAIVDATSSRLGVSRRIAIYQSDRVGAPVTWGALRPVLVVPSESTTWSDELRRSVAAHEVAHVARNDYLMQLMATLACAVYWFHPLAWFVARRMRNAAERACDDHVLASGASGEEYAAHLIGVARVSRQLRLAGAVAIGMARPSTLEGRIVAVLDGSRRRDEPTSGVRRTVVAASAALLVMIGAVRPVAASEAPVSLPAVEVSEGDSAPSPSAAPGIAVTSPAPIVTTAPQGDSAFERSFSAVRGELLVLDLNTGGRVMVRAWDESRVHVRAVLGGPNWRDIEVDIDRETNGVRVASRFARRRNTQISSNEFQIMVPRRYDIRISSAGGSFTLVGVEGRFTGHTGGGGFDLDQLKGSARLTTGGGQISVRDSDLSGSVSTGGGTVRLSNVSGGLRGSSGSGPVIYGTNDRDSRSTTDISSVGISAGGSRVTVGRDTDYRAGTLNIDKAGGGIDLDGAPNGAHVRTGGGDVRIGRSAGTVDAGTGGGDVTIGPVAGSVSASTGAGEVRIVVDPVRGGDQVIEATSGKGRIVIELPADFDGRLDLETAYTRTHEETARIRSDWDLERDPLTDWDDRFGTPRRFLRARAVLGRGNGRVVVRTVNGEIEIRKR